MLQIKSKNLNNNRIIKLRRNKEGKGSTHPESPFGEDE